MKPDIREKKQSVWDEEQEEWYFPVRELELKTEKVVAFERKKIDTTEYA
ncbi:MAG: hypothetical protein LBC40_07890 [Dysgonamonadaceae bacterium]|jgi:hypothetical protein|nr:hypothetical protein [Dysgonamonadaceae bacterium]